MRRITTCIAAATLLLCVAVSTASAKITSRLITVGQDFSFAGKTVKAGTYRFSFDEQKNELSIIDRKTKEVVATTVARAERTKKGTFPALLLEGESAPLSFAGLSFDGRHVIRASNAAAVGN